MKPIILHAPAVFCRKQYSSWNERITAEVVGQKISRHILFVIECMIGEIEQEKRAFQGRLREEEWEALVLLRAYQDSVRKSLGLDDESH